MYSIKDLKSTRVTHALSAAVQSHPNIVLKFTLNESKTYKFCYGVTLEYFINSQLKITLKHNINIVTFPSKYTGKQIKLFKLI